MATRFYRIRVQGGELVDQVLLSPVDKCLQTFWRRVLLISVLLVSVFLIIF